MGSYGSYPLDTEANWGSDIGRNPAKDFGWIQVRKNHNFSGEKLKVLMTRRVWITGKHSY